MYVGGTLLTAAEIHGALASLVIAIPRQWGLVEHGRDEGNNAQSEAPSSQKGHNIYILIYSYVFCVQTVLTYPTCPRALGKIYRYLGTLISTI